jgi:hypothetical protein
MKQRLSILLLIAIFYSCEKQTDIEDPTEFGFIEFSVNGRFDQKEIYYTSKFSTVRDSFYSHSFQLTNGYKAIEFIRYPQDYNGYIEMQLTFDSLGSFVPGSFYNALNYDISFNISDNENNINLETYILITFDTVYMTPFEYSNIEFNKENNSVSGNFGYLMDSTNTNSDFYLIEGDFNIILSK